jgi:hypothetical protein
VFRHPVVHHDDDEALRVELVGDAVGGDLARPAFWLRAFVRKVDSREGDDGPGLIVIEDDEVVGAQSADGVPALVEHGHVEAKQLDVRAEARLRKCLPR